MSANNPFKSTPGKKKPAARSSGPPSASSTPGSTNKRKTKNGSPSTAARGGGASSRSPASHSPAGSPKGGRTAFTRPRKPVKAMEIMREACDPYDWSRQSWKLMLGEQMLLDPKQGTASDEVTYRDELNRRVAGLVYVTTYQLRFYPGRHVKIPASYFRVPLTTLARVEVPEESDAASSAAASQIQLFCKDGRTLRFVAPLAKCMSLRDILVAYAFPSKLKYSFPFSVTAALEKLMRNEQDKDVVARVTKFRARGPRYSCFEEFERCGALPSGRAPRPAPTPWRMSQVNQTYEFSPTYPALNIMPAGFSDAEVKSIGAFRSKCRIPSMSWCMPGTGGRGPTIWRCSQPKVGMQSKRNRFDEALLRAIAASNSEHAHLQELRKQQRAARGLKEPSGKPPACLILGDCRPQVTAYANKVAGGGYEEEAVYDFLELKFLNIDNIHKVRGALGKLAELTAAGKYSDAELTHWYKSVEDTKWLYLLRVLLLGTVKTANEMLVNRRSVVVHCSDGWDRTSELCALVQLLLDPFARTIDGFCILIQKDWLSFGHQFQRRYGHGSADHDDTQRSPIFIQFLDAVWQFLNQHPEFFEFNSALLVLLADELYACRFGTFLCNTEAERTLKYSLERNTLSLWDYVEEHRERYRNPRYLGDDAPLVPSPQACLRNVEVWGDYHLRWGANPSAPSWNVFDTKRLPPPYTWPSTQQVAVAHAKRAVAAAVLSKTAPLEARNRALEAEVRKLRSQLRAATGRPHMEQLLHSPKMGGSSSGGGSGGTGARGPGGRKTFTASGGGGMEGGDRVDGGFDLADDLADDEREQGDGGGGGGDGDGEGQAPGVPQCMGAGAGVHQATAAAAAAAAAGPRADSEDWAALADGGGAYLPDLAGVAEGGVGAGGGGGAVAAEGEDSEEDDDDVAAVVVHGAAELALGDGGGDGSGGGGGGGGGAADGGGRRSSCLETSVTGSELVDRGDDPLGDLHSASDDEAAEAVGASDEEEEGAAAEDVDGVEVVVVSDSGSEGGGDADE